MRRIESLFADRNNVVIAVCRVMHEDEADKLLVLMTLNHARGDCLQLVGAVSGKVLCHVYSEMEIAATIETSILAVNVDPCFVVDSSKVQVCPFSSPVFWNVK
jgi:hypothetical protein